MSSLRDRAMKRHEAQLAKQSSTSPSTQEPTSGDAATITPKLQRAGATAALEYTVSQLPISATMPVKLDALHVRPGYERHPSEFQGPEWEAFVASIAGTKGNLQPIDVREVRGAPTLYQIIAGERRFRAMTQLGLKSAICAVREVDEDRADLIHDTENAQRADKKPFSLAMQLSVMMKSGRYKTQDELSTKLGRSPAVVSRFLKLYDDAPSDLWSRVKDPTALQYRDAELLIKAYQKPGFADWIRHLDRSAVTPLSTVLKKARELTARPKPEKTTIDKIREVERGDNFHIVLPKAIPAEVRAKILAMAKQLASE